MSKITLGVGYSPKYSKYAHLRLFIFIFQPRKTGVWQRWVGWGEDFSSKTIKTSAKILFRYSTRTLENIQPFGRSVCCNRFRNQSNFLWVRVQFLRRKNSMDVPLRFSNHKAFFYQSTTGVKESTLQEVETQAKSTRQRMIYRYLALCE